MPDLEFSVQYSVPIEVIYNALTDPFELMKYTRTQAKSKPEVNGEFELYEGKIQGQYIELEKNKKIKQNWKFNDWKDYSLVEIEFQDQDDYCKINVKQTNLPSTVDKLKLEQGWMNQIFKPMSLICGYPFYDE